ncbi:MAG: VIT1/CCC1 transporter family protein [Alphaproteobacteria bacterium]|nr:VIT1/CCC1 transporter family protein [Alphaproteobacteria bacterium]
MQCKNYFWDSIILGMHDAIVSTIGLITGLVFASASAHVVLLTGIIASCSAALSMAASQYLAKHENNSEIAIWHGMSTGIAYLFTASMLLIPFLLINNPFIAITMTYITAIAIIFFFNFIKSKLCGTQFWSCLARMLIICAAVTSIAFLIGEGAKLFLGIEI